MTELSAADTTDTTAWHRELSHKLLSLYNDIRTTETKMQKLQDVESGETLLTRLHFSLKVACDYSYINTLAPIGVTNSLSLPADFIASKCNQDQ